MLKWHRTPAASLSSASTIPFVGVGSSVELGSAAATSRVFGQIGFSIIILIAI
jgi:hypothetical protein